MAAPTPSARLSLRAPAGPPGHSPSRATPDSPAAAAPLSTRWEMPLETLFPLRSIDQAEAPSLKRLLPTPTAGLLLTRRPAESAPALIFPAGWYDRRPADRIHRYPR